MSSRDRVLAWLAPIVLVAVACSQIFLATTRDLSPWRGGGFAMFASVDVPTWRAVHGTFHTDEGDILFDVHGLAEIGTDGRKAFTNARALLDDRRAARLVEIITASEWVVVGGVARFEDRLEPGTPGPIVRQRQLGEDVAIEVHGGRLEVWRAGHERRSGWLVPHLAGRYEFAVGEPP